MENKSLLFVLAVVELVSKYGVPAVLQILKDWEVDNPSIEQIRNLHARVPKPDTYFESE